MEYKVSWLIEDAVIYLAVYDEVDIITIRDILAQIRQLMESSKTKPVHMIINATQVSAKTHNIVNIWKEFREGKSEHWGFTIVIGGMRITRFIVHTIMQISGTELRFTDDIDGAMKILYLVHPELVGKPILLPQLTET